MKVAIISESPADEAAIRILVEALLNQPVETVPRRHRAGGWQAALNAIEPVLKAVHYRRSAEALVVVLDSNSSPIHRVSFEKPCENPEECRLCAARDLIRRVQGQLTPIPSREPILTAVGLAVPIIEAWYLCGEDQNVSEGAWTLGLAENRRPYTGVQLKELVYGTSRPSIALETKRAEDAMRRVVQDLDLFGRRFPRGFGALRWAVGRWGKCGGTT
jgi:hypothetical protein